MDGQKDLWNKKFNIYSQETGVPVNVVRPFNIYGERYNWVGKYSQAIPMFVKKILDKEKLSVVWGSGSQRRNYLHAEDCARIIKIIMEKDMTISPVNIGFEKTISMTELVNLILKISKLNL